MEGLKIEFEWNTIIRTLIDLNSGEAVIQGGDIVFTTIPHKLKLCFEKIAQENFTAITETEFKLLLDIFSSTSKKLEDNGHEDTAYILNAISYTPGMFYLRKKYGLIDWPEYGAFKMIFPNNV